MAHSRTARKAIRQNKSRRTRNKAATSAMRTQIKRAQDAAQTGADNAQAELARAQKLVDKSAKGNRIHPNKAARIKSRLARMNQVRQ